MKKFILGLMCGFGLAMSTAVVASDAIRATLFPVSFDFNGVKRELDSRYQVLNYEGFTYVPIRFVAENMGAGASYDPETQTVHIVSEPSTDDPAAYAKWVAQYRLVRGMETKDVKRWLGDPAFITRIEAASQQVWRYDFGTGDQYRHGGMNTDISGLKDGSIEAQLFLTWNSSGTLERVDYWYTVVEDEELQIYTFIVYPDGSTSDTKYE